MKRGANCVFYAAVVPALATYLAAVVCRARRDAEIRARQGGFRVSEIVIRTA